MHHKVFGDGLRRNPLGSSQRSPDPLAEFIEPHRDGGERKGRREGRDGKRIKGHPTFSNRSPTL